MLQEVPRARVGGSTEALVGFGVSYGISDLIEVGGDYAFQLTPKTDAAGVFAGHVRLRLVHNSQVSAALGVAAFYSDSLTGTGVSLFAGGLSLRYRFTPQLSLYTESNFCGGCVNIAGPVMGQALIVHIAGSSGPNGTNAETLVAFTIPVGLAYQASPQVYLYASTIIGAIAVSPKTDSYLEFRDVIPVIAGAWITVAPKFEIGASITDDLKDASNNYFFELGGRVSI